MPRTKPLTQAQREEEARRREEKNDLERRKLIAAEMRNYQHDRKLTNTAMGLELGLGRKDAPKGAHNTVTKLRKGENVKLEMDVLFKLLKVCGYRVEREEKRGSP